MNQSAEFSDHSPSDDDRLDPNDIDGGELEVTPLAEQPTDAVTPEAASDDAVVVNDDHDAPADEPDDAPAPRAEDTEDTPADDFIWDEASDLFDSSETIPLGLWNDELEETAVVHDVTLDPKPIIKTAKVCHVGAVRDRNDDSCLSYASDSGGHFTMMPFGLYVVADGMGGHANGHIASRIASRVAATHVLEKIYLPLLRDADAGLQTPIQEVLVDAVQLANAAVYNDDPESDSGTTLTAGLLLGRRLYVAHVGDSRAYLFANDELQMITTDHTLVQRLQEVGQLTEEEAAFYQYRHVVLRAVGQADQVEVDTYMRRLPPSGRLLFCSDGLSGMMSDRQIKEIMAQDDISLEEMAEQLFLAAIAGGGYDNITALLVDFAF